MTFRPSDDVLDDISVEQQTPNNVDIQSNWEDVLVDFSNNWNMEVVDDRQDEINAWNEEIKSPELSQLLNNDDTSNNKNEGEENDSDSFSQDVAEEQPIWDKTNNQVQNDETLQQQTYESDSTENGKLSDEERSIMVSWIEGSINSDLDMLVDNNCINIIGRYKKLNRLFFRWWASAFFAIIGIISWIILQVRAWTTNNIGMVDDSFIENKNAWVEDTPDKTLSSLYKSWFDIKVLVPYGTASGNSTSFRSKSNLISYKWLILPQLSFIDLNSENLLSLEDFDLHKSSRKDLEKAIRLLIISNSIYRKTTSLPNTKDFRWVGKSIEWSLIDWFNLWCINSSKVSNFICDGFLETFYQYGKYYDLNKYSSEILELAKKLKKEGKPKASSLIEFVQFILLWVSIIWRWVVQTGRDCDARCATRGQCQETRNLRHSCRARRESS